MDESIDDDGVNHSLTWTFLVAVFAYFPVKQRITPNSVILGQISLSTNVHFDLRDIYHCIGQWGSTPLTRCSTLYD